MSLFNDLKWDIIENPKSTYNYVKVLKKEKEAEEDEEKIRKKKWKELCAQKKQELSKEEYDKWRVKEWYQWNKEWYAKKQLERYYKEKAEEEEMIEGIYKEIYDALPELIDYDKFYMEKYRNDDINYEWRYKFSWRFSRLNWISPGREKKYLNPIKLYNTGKLNLMITNLNKIQDDAYKYLKPHLNEISIKDFSINKNQIVSQTPMRVARWKMRELKDATNISSNQLCSVASAMLRDKYIVGEVYMWRASFLVGDIIITQNGNVLRPCLENNIPWLTPDTVEELHKKRLDWLKKKIDDLDIYILRDTYLVKYQPNEFEQRFYLIPT